MSAGGHILQLITNGAASSGWVQWPGGAGVFAVEGTWSGATIKLQGKLPNGTAVDIGAGVTLTADAARGFVWPQGEVRALVSGGPPSAIYAKLYGIDVDAPALAASGSGGATEAKQDTQITALQLIDDIVHTDDAAFVPGTSKVAAIGAIADETAADSVDEGDVGALRMTLDRLLKTAARIDDTTIDDYETVAASQADQILGPTGAQGDYLAGVLIVPATTSPGAVSIKDANGSAITIFTGGASSVSNLVPFFVPIGAKCTGATTPGWKVTTGANVSAIATGKFT